MARAGTAFIAVRGDFSTINKQVAAYGKTLDRSLNRQTNAWQAATKQQTKTLQQLGRTARFAAGGIGLLGGVAVVKSIGKAADFEQQMSRLGAVSSATGNQMEVFKRQAIAAGAATKFSALDAAAAQTELAKGGLSVEQIMGGGLKAALGLAAAGELDLADAAKFAVNAIKLFGLRGKEAGHVADAFATAANATTADVSDFGLAMAQGGSAAHAAGLSFTDTTLALEALAQSGIKSSDAGTSLKTSLAQLAAPTKKQRELTKELGLDFFDAQGNMKGIVEISDMLRNKLGGMTREQRLANIQTLVGTDGMRTLLSLYQQGPDRLEKLRKGLDKEGSAAEVARKKQDNFKGALENFKGSIETLQISIGSGLLPVFTDTAKRLTKWANQVAIISNRKDLDVGEKIHRSLDLLKKEFGPDLKQLDLPGKLADAISAAIPLMANAAAKAAPKVVGTFVRAFVEASPWGRLAIGGFLLHKLGGIAAFKALGTKTGGAYAEGFAASSAVGGAAGGAAAGVGAGALGGAAAGRAGRNKFGNEFRHGAPVSQLGPRKGALGKLGGKLAGGLPAIALTVGLVLGPDVVRNFKKGLHEAFGGEKTDFQVKVDNIVDPIAFTKLDKQVKTGKIGVEGLKKEFSKLSRAQLSLGHRGELLKGAESITRIGQEFKRLRNQAVPSLKEVRTVAEAQFKRIGDVWGTSSNRGRRALQKNFDASLGNVRAFMDGSLKATRRSLPQIARLMSVYSGRGTQDVDKNLKLFRGRLSSTFVRAGHITKDGMLAIRLSMTNELEGLGLSQGAIKRAIRNPGGPSGDHSRGPTRSGGRRAARGALIQFGTPGAAGPDNIPVNFGAEKIMVGSGEVGAVFNRHQLPVLNARLSDMGGLPGLFKKYNQKHSAAGGTVGRAKRFARGGLINIRNIVALGRELQREGFAVGEHPAFGGVHPVHVKGSYHYSGQAIDVNADNFPGGEAAALDKLDARLKRLPGVIELLWRVAGHFDHLHVAMGGKGGKLPGGGGAAGPVPTVAGQKVIGSGALATGVQAALDAVQRGAQTKLGELAPSGDIGEGKFTGSLGGSRRSLGKRMAEAFAGWGHGPEWGALDDLWGRLEGSWNENLANLAGSGAYGIAQALPSSKYPPAGRPDAPPGGKKAAAQISWGLDYIRGRYGDPLGAHAARLAQGWYGEGGLIEAAGGVAFGGGARGPTQPHRPGKDKKKDKPDYGINDKTGKPFGPNKHPGPPSTRDLRYSVPGKNPHTVGGKGLGGTPAQALRKTLKRSRKSKDLKKTLAPFLKRMKKFGLPERKLAEAKKLLNDHARYADFALNADKLSTTDADGNTIMGAINGQSVLGWDVKDLGAQFKLRNRLIDIREIIVKRRAQVARALKIAEKRLKVLTPDKKKKNDKGKVPSGYGHTSPMAASWNNLLPKSRKKFRKQFEDKGGRLADGLEWAKDNTVHKTKSKASGTDKERRALKKIVPVLKNQKDGLNTGLHGDGGVLGQLTDLQGNGPKGKLKSPWPIGTVFGGTILDTQVAIKELTAKPPSTTDSGGGADTSDTSEADSERADLLAQLLREANLRTSVSERAFDVFKNFPPFGGQFATGGVVPGRTGEPRTIIAHGGETVTPPGASSSGEPAVYIKFADGMGWLQKFVSVEVDRGTRRSANAGGRVMPGRAGSLR